MKARMRRLSASVDAAFLDHHHHHQRHSSSDDVMHHGSSKHPSAEVSESRIDRVRRLISSPLTRRKSACTSSTTTKIEGKVFGTSLEIVAHQENPNQIVAKEPSIPFIMTRLCRYIEVNNGLDLEGLFRTSGNAKLIEKLRSSFDAVGDAPLESDGDIPSAAALLKLFLRELPEPLIPSDMHSSFITVVKDYSTDKEGTIAHLKALVDELPDENYYILKYLSYFLHRVALRESRNRMNPASLGIVFGPNIFRVSTDDYKGLREQAITNQVVTIFVSQYDKIFEEKRNTHLSVLSRFNTLPPLHVDIPSSDVIEDTFISVSPNLLTQNSEISMGSLTDDTDLPILLVDDSCLMTSESARFRRERRFLGLLSPGTRSSSEERKVTKRVSHSLKVFEMRRCSSHEEVAQTIFDEPTTQSSSPPVLPEAKRRVFNKSDQSDSDVNEKQSGSINDMELGNDSGIYINVIDSSEIVKSPAVDGPSKDESIDDGFFHQIEIGNHAESHKGNHERLKESNDNSNSDMCNRQKGSTNPTTGILSEIMETESRTENTKNGATISSSILREIPQFDLNTLHQNAEGCEPVISEHRYSWPSLSNWTSNVPADDPSQNNPSPSSYPLVQHASVQCLKKANSYEAPVSPSAYRGFLNQRVCMDETIPPSPPVSHKEIFPAKKSSMITETVGMKELKRKIHSMKKKLRCFENEFEQEHGYKPSYEQKMNSATARSLLIDLNKNRRDLKELKESRLEMVVDERPESKWSLDALDSPIYNKPRGSVDIDVELFRQCETSEAAAVNRIVSEIDRILSERRQIFGRPESVEEMTTDQVLAEKHDLQKLLLKYESFFGRPETREDREAMRPLYEKYRLLKRTASRLSSKAVKKDSTELQPILEHVQMNFSSPNNSRRSSLEKKAMSASNENGKEKDFCLNNSNNNTNKESKKQVSNENQSQTEAQSQGQSQNNLHELPLCELMKQLQEVAEEKKHLRRVIKNFEDDFQKKMGRKVEKEDKINLESVYTNYKHVKGKLRLMEALVAKTEKLRK